MSFTTPHRLALIVVATVGLLFFAGMLLLGDLGNSGPNQVGVIGCSGAVAMGLFATGCAATAARAAHGRQRLAWTVMATGLAGWTLGASVWLYGILGGRTPFSDASVADLGFVVLPAFALVAGLVVPSRGGFGTDLVLDGVLVGASLLLVMSALTVGAAGTHDGTVSFTQLSLVTISAIYLALVVMSLIVVTTAPRERRLSPALLTVGFSVMAFSGLIHVFTHWHHHMSESIAVLGWIGGTYFLALSAIASRPGSALDTGLSRPPSRLSTLLPYLPLAAAVVVGAVHLWPLYRGDAFVFSVGLVVAFSALVRHMVLIVRKQQLLNAVSEAARRDAVTGLANRRLLEERLARAVRLYLFLAVPVSVLRVRVDDFKVVEETLGYDAGDELLRNVGARIQAGVRGTDIVARMGGDDFAILVEDHPAVASQVAERLARSFDTALDIGVNKVYVHLSVGVASAGADPRVTLAAGDLLVHAEAARTRAERTSATDVQIFTPELDAPSGRREEFRDGVARLQLLWDLRRAIDDRSLTLVYQPQFEMRTGAVCGAEALLRWQHPTLGNLGPREFLPLVREHGLMDAVTDVVLSKSIADAARWRELGTEIRVAINLWAASLADDPLPDRILSVLDAHGMPADLLTVEITEELVVADFEKGRAVLNRLRAAGIRVAIDDFGSGYSTLTYLRELPIDEVKLDHQLIAPILYDQRAATIARSVIELSDELGIASVAEGVENEGTAQWLKKLGCDVVQGNYFSGPLPAGEIPYVSTNPVDTPVIAD